MTTDYEKQEQARQIQREEEWREAGAERSKERREKQIKRSGLSTTTSANSMIEDAIPLVVAELEKRIAVEDAKAKGVDKKEWYEHIADTFLNLKGEKVPVVQLSLMADVALRTCLDAVGHIWTYNATIVNVGRAYRIQRYNEIMGRIPGMKKELGRLRVAAAKRHSQLHKRIEYVHEQAMKRGFDIDNYFKEWDEVRCRMIGSLLVDAVQLGSNVIEIRPRDKDVLIEDPKTGKKRKVTRFENVMSLTDEAAERLRVSNETLDGAASLYGPMISPPVQYPNAFGPYMDANTTYQVPMVKKVWNPDHQKAIDEAVSKGTMDGCLRAINRIQVTPYTINEWVLDAVKWVKAEKPDSDLEKFPALDYIPVPEKIDPDEFKKLSKDQQIAHGQSITDARKANLEVVASLKVVGTSLDEAGKLVGECFFLPHQFDKRGRVYHTSNFGHHNADWMRGLIIFWNKGAITKDNVEFLKLALANAWGDGDNKKIDKASFKDRIAWVDENVEKIKRCGNNFQASFNFWSKADDPFQFLAACRDYYMWDKHGDGYETGLPIGLDATNSGYQHYAAANRNRKDAKSVNLLKGSADVPPEDLYVECLHVAQRMMQEDIDTRLPAIIAKNPKSEEGKDAKKDLTVAKQLQAWGGLTRKICKRPVMTWGYSSRRYGFSDQLRTDWIKPITKKLKSPTKQLLHPLTGEEVTEHPFGEDEGFHMATYLAGVLENAIEETVTSARDGQRFFKMCAKALAKENKHFKFTTPLGFPMEQFYREADKRTRQRVYLTDKETRLEKKQAKADVMVFTDKVKMPKSENAVSPNIIHSMDATHLMKTVLLLDDHDVTDIMVVHDCFATTIDNVETMYLCVRKAFRDLYSDYCLYTDVLNQTIAQLDHPETADLPSLESVRTKEAELDLDEVMESPYAFS